MQAAVDAGADAIGPVFYPASPRYVEIAQAAARRSRRRLRLGGGAVRQCQRRGGGPCGGAGAAQPAAVPRRRDAAGLPDIARRCRLPYLRAARVRPGLDLVEFADQYHDAAALLLDAFIEGYGGGGHVFDWTLIPRAWLPPTTGSTANRPVTSASAAPRIVLSGGLSAQNVAGAIERVRPYAVDVSSGVEAAKGVKDHARIAEFVRAVRAADAS